MALNSVLEGHWAEGNPETGVDGTRKGGRGTGWEGERRASSSLRARDLGAAGRNPPQREAREGRSTWRRSGPARLPPDAQRDAARARPGFFCPRRLGFPDTRSRDREASPPGEGPGRPARSLKAKEVGGGRGRGGARRAGGRRRLRLGAGSGPGRRASPVPAASRAGGLRCGSCAGK